MGWSSTMRQLPSAWRRDTTVPRVAEPSTSTRAQGVSARSPDWSLSTSSISAVGPRAKTGSHGGPDRVSAADAATVGRHDHRRIGLVQLDERVEVAGVDRGGEQRVDLLGALGGHQAGFCQTETCEVLSPVNDRRHPSSPSDAAGALRSRAIRSSSDGHT